jgi:hypothetical protein
MTASPTDDNAFLEHRNRELTKELSEAREQQVATAESNVSSQKSRRVLLASAMQTMQRFFRRTATFSVLLATMDRFPRPPTARQ